MLRNEAFFEKVAARAGASEQSIRTVDGGMEVSMTLAPPASIQRFIGASLNVLQTITWDPDGEDGTYSNRIAVTVRGMPVAMDAAGHIAPEGEGTVVTYTGDLKTNIPVIGKKIEEAAKPYLVRALDAQADVGRQWLAEA